MMENEISKRKIKMVKLLFPKVFSFNQAYLVSIVLATVFLTVDMLDFSGGGQQI